jgi:predicted ferric reductase
MAESEITNPTPATPPNPPTIEQSATSGPSSTSPASEGTSLSGGYDALFNTLKERVDKLEEESKNTQTKLIESLGIFTALFTFISISIQIFHNIQYLDVAVALIIFLFIALSGFVYLLDTILNKNKYSFTSLVIIVILLIAVAYLLAPSSTKIRLSENTSPPTPVPSLPY